MAGFSRNVDRTTASLDIQGLNNQIIATRKLTKRIKLQIINKLTKQIRLYKKKKGSEEQMRTNKKKIENLIQEIQTIKGLDMDEAAKYSLGNMKTLQSLGANVSIKEKCLVRLATHPLMMEKVASFRSNHNDWQELASFIMSKHSGRRVKNKAKFKREVDRFAAEVITSSPNEGKTVKQEHRSKQTATLSSEEKDSDAGASAETEEMSSCINVTQTASEVAEVTKANVVDSLSDSSEDSDSEESNESYETEENRFSDKLSVESAPLERNKEKTICVKNTQTDKVRNEGVQIVEELKPKDIRHDRSEVIVKEFNMEEMDNEPGSSCTLASVPLLSQPVKTRPRDCFFMSRSDSEDELEMEEEQAEEPQGTSSRDVERNTSFVKSLSGADKAICSKRNVKRHPHERSKMHEFGKGFEPQQSNPVKRLQHGSKNVPSTSIKQQEPEKLHPSWVASRMRKQQQSQIQAFQGKKITFDD